MLSFAEAKGSAAVFVIMIYMIFSAIFAITGWMAAGWSAGLSALGASLLAIIAGGGLRAALKGPYLKYKIGAVLFAALLVAAGLWMSQWFSVQIFSLSLSGAAWCVIGFGLTFLLTPKHMLAVPEA